MFGWLSNRLPDYPDTLNLRTDVWPQDGNKRPLVTIQSAHAEHPLYVEQQQGITPTRLGQLHARHACPNGGE